MSREPIPETASADRDATARPIPSAAIGESLAVSFSITMVGTGAGIPTSGGWSGLELGIEIGIGILVNWFWMNTIGRTVFAVLKVKLRDSTLVCESISKLSAG